MQRRLPDGNFIRTDFSDDQTWQETVDAASQPWDLGGGMETWADLTFVDDLAFDGLTLDELRDLTDETPGNYYVFIADTTTLNDPERPILVVNTGPYRPDPNVLPAFRAIPSEMPSIENNLSLGNMDFDDFAREVDDDGVFRGFREPEGDEPFVAIEPESTEWITHTTGPTAGKVVHSSEVEGLIARIRREKWGGGEPIEAIAQFNGGQKLAQFDRALVEQIVSLDDARLREVAVWSAEQAFAVAGIAGREAFVRGIESLKSNGVLPPDLVDQGRSYEIFRPFDGENYRPTSPSSSGVSVRIIEGIPEPFVPRNIHKPSYAIPAFYAAAEADPLRAAIEALFHATETHCLDDPAALHQRLRAQFGLSSAT